MGLKNKKKIKICSIKNKKAIVKYQTVSDNNLKLWENEI